LRPAVIVRTKGK
uniref:Hyposin-H4 n=1 Tax=Pithecopus azureus TaxID=2034991 RepID=HPS4_PITAZ|nr:RecName: Full=Hyposin-H4; Short=HPS-H4; AltName: Full=Hyposin-3; AltName: Full=Hyposin-HA3 [Pithecopus azureus]